MPWGIGHSSSSATAVAEPAPEQHNSKDASIGVKVVYTPPSDVQPVADIVAVHGLKGDAFKTWTYKSSKPGANVFWLQDLLPTEVPNARILTYGYDSDPGKVFESASTNMVHHHATTLVAELHYFRRKPNERQRPIIFVCHSLGGIVVKRALIYSSTCNISHNPELRSIRISTHGIVFLGTPHMGADLARWGKMAEMLVRLVTTKNWVDSNDALIAALGSNSETLQNITDSFVGLSMEFEMFFFWEELKTLIPGMTRDVIVEYASAVPQALPNAGRAGIHATHSDMCKFSDENAPGWNILAGVLSSYVARAPATVAAKWQQLFEQEHLDVGWKIRTTLHGHRYRTPSPGKIDSGHGQGMGGGPIVGAQRQGMLTGVDELEDRKRLPAPPVSFRPPNLQENKFFCGRRKELARIHETLTDPFKRTLLIASITGGGKTHLAREYFFTRREDYPGGVFWVSCKAPATGKFSKEVIDYWYYRIAEELQLPHTASEGTPRATVGDVVAWFGRNTGWLLVLDGVDIDSDSQCSTVAQYLPHTTSGSIILTSINATLTGSARLGSPDLLALDPPSLEEAVQMLAHYSHISTTAPTAAYTDLCRALSCLPLAIHSAGSYIKEKKLPVEDYLRKHQRHPFAEREYLGPFHVVFDRLEAKYPQAAGLVNILSFWGRGGGGGVPFDLIWWGARVLAKQELNKVIARDGTRRNADLDVGIGQCLRFAIMERGLEMEGNVSVDTLRLHPIAKEVCVARMTASRELDKWCRLAVDVFCNSFEHLESRQRRRSSGDSEEGSQAGGRRETVVEFLTSDYARYLTHATHIADSIRRYKLSPSERLAATQAQLQKLANAKRTGDGVSMFARNDSGSTSGPELDTPSDDRGFFAIGSESPDSVLRSPPPNTDRFRQEEIKVLERRLMENAKNLDFEFRYPPPKAPRNWRSSGGGRSRRGRGRSATVDGYNYGVDPLAGRGGRSYTGLAPPERGQSRGRSPMPVQVPQLPPMPPLGTHYNPYGTRDAGPYLGRYNHASTGHQHSSSAPAHFLAAGFPSPGYTPAYTPAYPFISSPPPFTPMPPYPLSPGPNPNDYPSSTEPLRPRPFSRGFTPTHDITQSPVLRSVADVYVHRRAPSQAPSEACSEPIIRSRSQSPAGMFAMEVDTSGRRSVTNMHSPYPPPPVPAQGFGQGFGLGIDTGTGDAGFLLPYRQQRPTSGTRASGLRRSSVPRYEPEGGEGMERSRSEPGVNAPLRAGVWLGGGNGGGNGGGGGKEKAE